MNNSAESQPTNGKVAQPKSENKAKVEKMVEIQQIKVWSNQQLKHCLQQT